MWIWGITYSDYDTIEEVIMNYLFQSMGKCNGRQTSYWETEKT